MHKHTKLTPIVRKKIYEEWKETGVSFRKLGSKYHVDKNVISDVIVRGKRGDFSVHDSKNTRYKTIEYGLKKLLKTEEKIRKKNTHQRYERCAPGELVHGDTKRLPHITGETQKTRKREVLFVAIDDYSRFLVADILPDKTQWSAKVFLETCLERLPFSIECHYSDNGTEYKGCERHAFVKKCAEKRIDQKFTKPRHPWTNGKAERVIRTLLTEWFRTHRFTSHEERRQSLYTFVNHYNHERRHYGLEGKTPIERLRSYVGGDNA
jgi:transposase InsO family protein